MVRDSVKFLDLIITEQCNSRCKICSIWREGQKTRNELSLSDIKGILDSECLKEVSNVDLSGGEPFLREDLAEIIRMIAKKLPQARISISTNALDSESILKSLKRIKKISDVDLRISLDGLKETHNLQRGVKDAFERVIETVSSISKQFPYQHITFVYTISPWNFKDVLSTYKFVKSLNPKYKLLVTYAHDVANYKNYLSNKGEIDYKSMFKFSDEQTAVIKEQLESLSKEYMKEGDFANALFTNQIQFYLRNKAAQTFFCNAPSKMALILPSRMVYNCIMMESIGNLNKERLDSAVNSDLARNNKRICKNGECNGCMLFIGNHISYYGIGLLFEYFLSNHPLLEKKDILKLSLDDKDRDLQHILSLPDNWIFCSIEYSLGNKREDISRIIKQLKKAGKSIVLAKPISRCISGIDTAFIKKYAYMPTSCKDCPQLFTKEDGLIKICDYLKKEDVLNLLDWGLEPFFKKIESIKRGNKICEECGNFNRVRCKRNPCYF